MDNIFADEIIIGFRTFIDPKIIIRGINTNAKKVVNGDYCYIGCNVQMLERAKFIPYDK